MCPKSILFVSFTEFKGSRWGRTFPIAKAFAAKGYKTVLLTLKHKTSFKPFETLFLDNVHIICFNSIIPLKYLQLPLSIFTLNFILRILYVLTHKFTYVFSDCGEVPISGWPCKISQWVYKSKYISEYGDLLGKGGYYDNKPRLFKLLFGHYYLWSITYFRRTADFTVVLSEVMKKYAYEKMYIPLDKLILVPGGSTPNNIKYIESSIKTHSKIILGYIGIDDNEIKGILPVLECIRDNFPTKFQVYLFGQKISNNIINKYNIKDIIEEKGWVDVISGQNIIEQVDIFLLMRSNILIGSMGWPNKLGDYLSFGRPVLIDPYGDLISFVKNHSNGFINVDRNNKNNIKEQLQYILTNQEKMIWMGSYNRTIAENEISWDARVKTLISSIAAH